MFGKVADILPWRKKKESDGANGKAETQEAVPGAGTSAPKGEPRKLSEISAEELARVLTQVEVAKVREHHAGVNRNRGRRLLRTIGIIAGVTVLGALLWSLFGSDDTKGKLPVDKGPVAGTAFPVAGAAMGATRTGHIAVIKVTDGIGGMLHGEPSAANTPLYLQTAFAAAESDPDLAGVVLEINSYGGSAAASEESYRIVKAARERLAKKKIKVIAHTSLAALSGGYYIAMGVGHGNFFADPCATVGSIGVIMSLFNTEKLGELLGITENIIKTGPLKSVGAQWEKLTPEQRANLQESVDDSFELFLQAVSEGRGIDMATLRRESQLPAGSTNGGMFSAKRGLERKLIDGIVPVEDLYKIQAGKMSDREKFNRVEFIEYKARIDPMEKLTKGVGKSLGVIWKHMSSEMTHRDAPMRAE